VKVKSLISSKRRGKRGESPKVPITVTSPNGGETWEAGTSQDITWTSTGTAANVEIEYSIDNGTFWTEIIAATENDGRYEWIVPDNT
jgi:hypothetical protein